MNQKPMQLKNDAEHITHNKFPPGKTPAATIASKSQRKHHEVREQKKEEIVINDK
jgi:hypothetical protein